MLNISKTNFNAIIKSYYFKFYTILVFAFLSRIIICFYSGLPWYNSDTYSYFEMADRILNGDPFSYFPNGYPLLIVLLKLLISNSIIPEALIFLNIIFQLMTLFFIERILKYYSVNERLRLITLLVIAIYPNQINYTRQLLTEASSLFFLILTIYLYTNKKNLLSGFIGFLTSQFRPTLLPFLPGLILFELLNKNYRNVLTLLGGFLIGLFIFLILEKTNIIKPPNNLGTNLLISIQSDSYDIDWNTKNFTKEERSSPIKTYMNFAIDNPLRFLKQRLISLWVLWGPLPVSHRGIFEKLLIAIRFPLLILSILAMIFYKRIGLQRDFVVIISLPILLITAIHTMFFSQQRFTFVVEPFIITLSILFINHLYNLLKIKSR